MLKNLKTFNPAEVEEKVLEFWKTRSIFGKSLKLREGRQKKTFVFYEGPPYANGRPGIHHVLARVFKDIILRYKTMRGYYVPRRGGWDTHGLPVELEAEKQLGIKSKREIEKFGIALFNQKAKEAVWQYKDEWEKITERMGYWLDLKNAYVTYENPYIESCWWIFKEISKRGFLKKSYKIVPYCPRCQTPLASHELGMPGVYKKVSDPSVYIKLKLKEPKTQKLTPNTYLLVWTTTPWTLPSNVAVAVNSKLTYTKFSVSRDGKREYLWSYNPPPEIDGAKIEVAEKMSGQKLVGLTYEPLYKNSRAEANDDRFFRVFAADFVSTEEGTGLVHIAPAFGEDDLELIKARVKNLEISDVPMTVNEAGEVTGGFPGTGKPVKEADKDITEDLLRRGLLWKSGKIEHEYPFCWRCGTALLYFAKLSWFIEMSRLRKELAAANKKINWIPGFIKDGRFGNWIAEAKDWAISRDRYWGTPLPIWECERCADVYIAGSLQDLTARSYHRNKFLIMRHTEAEHNLSGFLASGPEKGKNVSNLTARGVKHAEVLAAKLKKIKISAIYASPYRRTKAAADIVAKVTGGEVVLDDRLREVNCGIFNWRPVIEHKKFFSEPGDEFTKTPPEGENLSEVRRRVFEFLRDINARHEGENILIVGHGDPLWMLEAAAKSVTNEDALALSSLGLGDVREIKYLNYPQNADGAIDMHRPFADSIFLRCEKCRGRMARVKDVADVWFDSGAMPFASTHYPFNKNQLFPADYICEGVDQTRGWFYTLLAISVLLGKPAPYRNAICLGLILDKNGIKMSKSKGNIVNPWEVIGKYGVDAVRWYFFTVNPPGEPKLFDEAEVGKTMRRLIMILYNSYVFYGTYGILRGERGARAPKPENVLDRWILARLSDVVVQAGGALESYEIGEGAKAIEALIDDLSRWYIRRSRRRFQKPVSKTDHEEASATLYFVLREIGKLLAPFTPFFAEALYQSLEGGSFKGKKTPESVHFADWPEAKLGAAGEKLIEEMKWVRSAAAAGLAKRAEAGIKVRQPLQKLRIKGSAKPKKSEELLAILKDELNVKEVVWNNKLTTDFELDTVITPELREEGLVREFTRIVQELRQQAGLKPQDRVHLSLEAGSFLPALQKHSKILAREVGARSVDFKRSSKFTAEITTKIEDKEIWVGLRKAQALK